MGKLYDGIEPRIAEFVKAQRLFFVATAPRADAGHVNVSPKGLDSFRVLDRWTVAYLDLTGSGAETIAHLRENGRITFMFCAFEGPPKIVRIHGRGEVLEPGDDGFDALRAEFPALDGVRAVIRASVTRVSDSCGFGVPLYRFEGDRTQLEDFADKKGPEGLRRYQLERNAESLDGLPAIRGRTLREEPGDG